MTRQYASLVALWTLARIAGGWEIDSRCLRRRRQLSGEPVNNSTTTLRGTMISTERRNTNINSQYYSHHQNHRDIQQYPDITVERLHSLEDITFNMRLHWVIGACWQEEWREREWCMQCEGNTCDSGDVLWLQRCANITQQRFVWIRETTDENDGGGTAIAPVATESDKGRLKLAAYDLCYQRIGINYYELRYCNATEDRQVLVRSTLHNIFELHPIHDDSKCLNQHHHPKPGESIITTTCNTARKWLTSYWKIYWPVQIETSQDQTVKPLFMRDPECSSNKPCGQCEGDCDRDNQCQRGLECFHRPDSTPVPGCDEVGVRGKDYCFKADPDMTRLRLPVCSASNPCRECQGDCGLDDHCEGDLKCFQRDGDENIPGCNMEGAITGFDYCYRDTPTDQPTDQPTVPPRDTDPPTSRPTMPPSSPLTDPLTDTPTMRPTSSPTEPPSSVPTVDIDPPFVQRRPECSNRYPCQECVGDCDSDSQCEGDLKCFLRSWDEKMPGCTGRAVRGMDYCYRPDIKRARLRRPPCSQSFPCEICEGECDRDSECAGNMLCFQRRDYTPIPGCLGMGAPGRDYCYEP